MRATRTSDFSIPSAIIARGALPDKARPPSVRETHRRFASTEHGRETPNGGADIPVCPKYIPCAVLSEQSFLFLPLSLEDESQLHFRIPTDIAAHWHGCCSDEFPSLCAIFVHK